MKNWKLSFESHNGLYEGLKYMSVVPLAFPSPEIWYIEKKLSLILVLVNIIKRS